MRRDIKSALKANAGGAPAIGAIVMSAFVEGAGSEAWWQNLPWLWIALAFALFWAGSIYRDWLSADSANRALWQDWRSRCVGRIYFDADDPDFRVPKKHSEDVRVAVRPGRQPLRNPSLYLERISLRTARGGWDTLNKKRVRLSWADEDQPEFVIDREDEFVPIFDLIPASGSSGNARLRINTWDKKSPPSVDLLNLPAGIYQIDLSVRSSERNLFGSIFVAWTGQIETCVVWQREDELRYPASRSGRSSHE